MAADVWFRRDIANALMAAYQAAMDGQAASGQPNQAYLAGQRAAIGTLALFFGISPALVLPEVTATRRGER